jgi:hypothetical protein
MLTRAEPQAICEHVARAASAAVAGAVVLSRIVEAWVKVQVRLAEAA